MAPSWQILGIDPDVHGAIARISGPEVGVVDQVRVTELPREVVTLAGGAQRPRLLPANIIYQLQLFLQPGEPIFPEGTVAYLEVPRSVPPRNSPTSTLVQGQAIGAFHAALLCMGAIVKEVRPRRWEAGLRTGANKNGHLAMARQLFPHAEPMLEHARQHGNADALLVAAYGHSAVNLESGATSRFRNDDLARRVRDVAIQNFQRGRVPAAAQYIAPLLGYPRGLAEESGDASDDDVPVAALLHGGSPEHHGGSQEHTVVDLTLDDGDE